MGNSYRLYRKTSSSGPVPGKMIPGLVDPLYFQLLVSVSSQRSAAMVNALEDVLVKGRTRKEVCEEFGVSASNLSVKITKLQLISQTIAMMYPCHFGRNDCPVSKDAVLRAMSNTACRP